MLQHVIIGADASYPHDTNDPDDKPAVIGKLIDLGRGVNWAALQIEWNGLTGVATGVLTMYTSLTGKRWIPKQRVTYKPALGTGEDLISLNDVLPEQYAKLLWTPNGITGGSLDCYVYVK